jgi:uncharacterized membrane protein YeaQ/YmgE (transglycosylase-associated protein family)
MGLLSWIIVGLIAGWLAGLIMRGSGFGMIGNIVVGVVGGVLGGWIASSVFHIGTGLTGLNLGSILIALFGAIVLILILRLLGFGRSRIID